MREIEFRAWDKKYHKMVGIGGLTDLFSIRSDGRPSNENYIPMQFTGLRDKHGKKIWEGDIVRTSRGTKVVIYGAPSFWLSDKPDERIAVDSFSTPLVYEEVIGNIHEHSELLTQK